jgi:hypothetical protein
MMVGSMGGGREQGQWETTPNDAVVFGEDKDLDDDKGAPFLLPIDMFGPHLVEVRCVTKSSDEGRMLGPHLVKVRCVTKSSDKGHILDHIWLKSAA